MFMDWLEKNIPNSVLSRLFILEGSFLVNGKLAEAKQPNSSILGVDYMCIPPNNLLL